MAPNNGTVVALTAANMASAAHGRANAACSSG
jgi:hypothetical protein